MIRNDGYLLLDDPDIQTTKRELPPHDSIIYLFPDPKVDARLYEWEVLVRNEADDRIFVPADPNSFVLDVSANQVKVTPTVRRDYSTELQIAGHLLGDHTLLKAELKGLTTQIVFNRQLGDTTDFTTLDWILYRWRQEENREYIREDSANYWTVKGVDKVTVILTNPVTSWISTRLLGYTSGASPVEDWKVKVTGADTTPDYLYPKLVAGQSIVITDLVSAVGISSTALTAGQHRTLRHLVHFIDSGPADGFLSGAFKEVLPQGSPFPTSVIWYVNSGKTQKIVEKLIERSAGSATNVKPTPITWIMYDETGTSVVAKVIDSITYSGVFDFQTTRQIKILAPGGHEYVTAIDTLTVT